MKRVLKDGNKWFGYSGSGSVLSLLPLTRKDDFDYAADFYEQQPSQEREG